MTAGFGFDGLLTEKMAVFSVGAVPVKRLDSLMHRVWRSVVGRGLAVVGVVALAGCGDAPPITFATDDRVEGLFEPAAEAFTQQMEAAFGQPLEPVVWESLPVQMHAAAGSVKAESPDAPTRLKFSPDYEAAAVEPGAEVVFTLGPNVAAVRKVVEYDADEQILEIDAALPQPVEGEQVAIGPGALMQKARPLYARHCQHCHGVSGDGNGPDAWSMNPKPRDFRQGKFKFTSTRTFYAPHRDDLMRTLDEGIAGTYMPSFKLLPEADRRVLVEYVIWLANRGEIENQALRVLTADFGPEAIADYREGFEEDLADAREDEDAEEIAELEALGPLGELTEDWTDFEPDLPEEFTGWAEAISDRWNNAQGENAVVVPTDGRPAMSPESIAEGRAIYLSDGAKCVSCHGRQGLGNGPQTLSLQRANDGDGYNDVPGLHDDWGNVILPRNLQTGIFRGGRRPIDVYRRLYSGINGSKMPGFGGSLTDEQIWHVVNYLYALGEDPTLNERLDATLAADDDDAASETPNDVAMLR